MLRLQHPSLALDREAWAGGPGTATLGYNDALYGGSCCYDLAHALFASITLYFDVATCGIDGQVRAARASDTAQAAPCADGIADLEIGLQIAAQSLQC